MPTYNVYLLPVMVLHIENVDAKDPEEAITKAIQTAETTHLKMQQDCTQVPVFADEFARYVVDPVVGGWPDYGGCMVYLDREHLRADRQDQRHSMPIYEHPRSRWPTPVAQKTESLGANGSAATSILEQPQG
jgi:hypothetical protein